MSGFWSKERGWPRWAFRSASVPVLALGVFGVLEVLNGSRHGWYAGAGQILGFGSGGGFALSALAMAGASGLVIAGVQLMRCRKVSYLLVGWLAQLALIIDPEAFQKLSQSEAWDKFTMRLFSLAMTGLIWPIMRWQEKDGQSKKEPTGA